MIRSFFAWSLIALGVFLILYLAGPMLLEGRVVMTFLLAVPGGLPLGVGIGLLDDTPPPRHDDSTRG